MVCMVCSLTAINIVFQKKRHKKVDWIRSLTFKTPKVRERKQTEKSVYCNWIEFVESKPIGESTFAVQFDRFFYLSFGSLSFSVNKEFVNNWVLKTNRYINFVLVFFVDQLIWLSERSNKCFDRFYRSL